MSLFNKIKAVKELRQQAKTMQSVLEQEKVEVTVKGVTVVMDGNQKIVSLAISDELFSEGKKEKVEEAVKDALSEAIKKVHRVMAEKMREMGGLSQLGL